MIFNTNIYYIRGLISITSITYSINNVHMTYVIDSLLCEIIYITRVHFSEQKIKTLETMRNGNILSY